MKVFLLIITAAFFLSACQKDKYSSSPQIKYESVSPNYTISSDPLSATPVVTFSLTDAEGDLGITGTDTAYIFIKNVLTGKSDSIPFPDLTDIVKGNFKADVLAPVGVALDCRTIPGGDVHIDTLYYEIYVKDFAGNLSNTIVTADPTFYECQ